MDPNDIITTANTVNQQAGGDSWLDGATNALTYGASAAVASGVASIYNTGVAAANFFGADADKIDVSKQLSDVDANWGQYYDQHKQVIDAAGFLATSFIPGGLAVKGLNLARRGEAFGAFGAALNWTSEAQASSLEKALQTLATPEGSIFSRLNKDFLGSIAWGAADNVIQTAAFQTGVLATMTASPMLEGQSFKDMSYDLIKTSLYGGAIAGGIEGFFANGIIKQGVAAIDGVTKKYESRLPEMLGGTSASDSDKAYSIIDAAMNLPKEVLAGDQGVPFKFSINGQTRNINLSTGAAANAKLQSTVKTAYTAFENQVTNHLAVDPSVGTVFAKSMLDLVQEGKAANLTDDAIRARAGDYLFNLKSIDGVGNQGGSLADDTIRFFNKGGPAPTDLASGFSGLLSKTEAPGLVRMRLNGNPADLQMSLIGRDHPLVKDAWNDGADLAFKPDGTWTINPASKLLRPAPESPTLQTFFNTQLRQTGDTAALTVADIATLDNPLVLNGDRVLSGNRQFNFTMSGGVSPKADTVEMTARSLWAGTLNKISGDIDSNDFSLIDRMVATKPTVDPGTTISIGDSITSNWKDLGNFDQWAFQNKVDFLRNSLEKSEPGSVDIQKIALQTNSTPQWVQDVIASKFNTDLKQLASGAPDLSQGWTRDLSTYNQRDNVILNYTKQQGVITDDFGNSVTVPPKTPFQDNYGGQYLADQTQPFITGMQSYAYRVALAKQANETAFAAVMGSNAARWSAFDAEGLSQFASRAGNGQTLVGFSDANYGDTIELMAQDSGKQVHQVAGELSDAAIGRLQPLLAQIKNDPAAAGELATITAKLRRSASEFVLLDTEYGLDGSYMLDKRLLTGSTDENIANIRGAAQTGTQGDMPAYLISDPTVAAFLKEHVAIDGDTSSKLATLHAAQGFPSNVDPEVLKAPPIDTTKVPFFAFVRPIQGKIFGDSSVHMITARTSEELNKLASAIDTSQFEVIFKKQSEDFFKAKGDYDYTRALNTSAVNSSLQREGKLGDFMPSFNPQDTLQDYLNYHQRRQLVLTRDAVSTKYAQTFAELGRLSADYTAGQTSRFGLMDKVLQRGVSDPYSSYMKTALDVSKQSEFTLLHQTNEYLDGLGTRAYDALNKLRTKATEGTISWEEANQQMVRYGMPGPYSNKAAFDAANSGPGGNLIKSAVQKANLMLSTFVIRLDAAQNMIHAITMPIMAAGEVSAIRSAAAKDPATAGKLADLFNVTVPGTNGQQTVPSTLKLFYNATKAFWGPDKEALLARYQANGDISHSLKMYQGFVNDVSLPGNPLMYSDFNNKVTGWVDKAASAFGTNLTEQFNRFVSANIMHQISQPLVDAGKMGIAEQNAMMSVFVNRVMGNYITSQRPILFQGTLGSALGLFQTFQFNLMQQIFRHIENKDLRTLAVMGGLHTTAFGLNSLPLFNAINTNLIGNANMNPGHRDIYSTVTQAAGKEAADWMLYGTASAFPLFGGQGPSLYTRGQIEIRHPTIIPTNPMDVPAVSGSIRFVNNLVNMGQKLMEGGAVVPTLLSGLEHNSISRPLAGIAQVMQGASTTNQGDLISANNDLFSIATASRLIGAKPLDESVGLNERYRLEQYKADDKARIQVLGQTVKDKIRAGIPPTQDDYIDLAGKYAAAGGNIATFGSTMQAWNKGATTSVLNAMTQHAKSSYGQRFAEVMGGAVLPDASTSNSNMIAPPPPVATDTQ